MLKEREITSNGNGYPQTGRNDKFVYGFENFEQVKEYAKEKGGEIMEAKWENGWHNCNITGVSFEPLQIEEDWYGDEYLLVGSDWKECYPELKTKSNKKHVKKYVDFKTQRALFLGDEFIDAVEKNAIEFHYDSKSIVIGVVVKK